MKYTFTAITAPQYAPDGSRGYVLTVERSGMVRNGLDTFEQTSTLRGFVDRTAAGRVIVSIDALDWVYVTAAPVALDTFTPQWVADHASDIVGAYGWSLNTEIRLSA